MDLKISKKGHVDSDIVTCARISGCPSLPNVLYNSLTLNLKNKTHVQKLRYIDKRAIKFINYTSQKC